MSESLRPHGVQHASPPCPSPTPKVYSNSCPSSRWCHPTISSSVIPFSSCLQSFPASGSFQMSQLFASVLEFQLQHQSFQWIFRDWFPLGWTAESPWSPRSLPQYQSSKASILQRSAFFIVQLSYPYKTGGKIIALTWQAFLSKVMSLLFNIQSRFVIAFLPRSKRLLISWLQSPSVWFGAPPPAEK